ncbi:hypothetical protein C8Q78DRAFT_978516 [Trametes maxima]|nr:hypothetical protein C8Q78DRAFT_978516 [Trametes maxima]
MGSDLNVTVGALLLGVLVTAVGYGITTLQTYMYMNRFPKDPWYIRWTVCSIAILDTTHIMLSWHMTYYYLIINFDNRPALDDSAIITVIVHCFYARRVYILGNKNWYLTVIIVRTPSYPAFGTSIPVGVALVSCSHYLPAEVGTGLGAGTLADCIITGSLVYFLRGHKSGFNQYVCFLPLYASIWKSVTQFSVMPTNMVFLGVHLLLSKLYANSLLATYAPPFLPQLTTTDHTLTLA